MQPQPQPIDRVVVLAPSIALLLTMVGCLIALTGMSDLPVSQVPLPGVSTRTLTEPDARSPVVMQPVGTGTAPGKRSLSARNRDDLRGQDRFSDRQAVSITPVVVDRSRDRRVDLMDMAISIRWHRGPASDLPPGSN